MGTKTVKQRVATSVEGTSKRGFLMAPKAVSVALGVLAVAMIAGTSYSS